MSRLRDNRTYISIIVMFLFVLIGGLLFAGSPVHAAPATALTDVVITLTANPTTVNEAEPGYPAIEQDVNYTLRVQNGHTETVRILTLTSTAPPPYNDLEGVGTCPATSPPAAILVVAGGTFECTFTLPLTEPATASPYNLQVTVGMSLGGDLVTYSDSDTEAVTIANTMPSVTVSKVANRDIVGVGAVPPLNEVIFTLDIQNSNIYENVDITSLVDSIYGDVTTLPTTCALPQTLTPSGQAGDSYNCTFAVNDAHPYIVANYTPGTLLAVNSNVAATIADDDGNTPSINSNSVSVDFTDQAADLMVWGSSESGAIGEQVVFTITFFNNGPNPASGASVEITNLDPDLTFVSPGTPTSGNYNSTTRVWSGIGTGVPIPPGGTATLPLTFRIDTSTAGMAPDGPQPPADIPINPAFELTAVHGAQYDSNPGNNAGAPNPDVTVEQGIQIVKSFFILETDGDLIPEVGEGLSWVICVTNTDDHPAPMAPTGDILVNDTLGSGQTVQEREWAITNTCPGTVGALTALMAAGTPFSSYPVNIGRLGPNGAADDVGVIHVRTTLTQEGFVLSSLMPVEIAQTGDGSTNVGDNSIEPNAQPPAPSAVAIQLEPEPFPVALVISTITLVLVIVLLTVFNLRDLSIKIRPQPVAWARVVVMVAVLLLAVLYFTQPPGAFAQEETPETPTDTVEPTDEPTETEAETATEETETPEPSETEETPEVTEETETSEPSDTPETSETPEETETPEPSETEETPEVTEEPSVVPTMPDQLNTPTPTAEASETPTETPTGQETIGGVIWVDMDEDGAVSSGDAPALNMLVALYMDDGDQVFDAESDLSIGEEATDAEGAYLFEQLEAGEYWVVVDTSTLPEEAVPDQQIEPQAVTAPGVVNFLLVAQTQLNTDLAEGAGRLTGKAFNDNNGNRVWDGDVESGLRYVDIVLYFDTGDSVFDPATDQEIDRVTTDWDGIYTFDQLGEGRYWVWLDESTMPENYIDSIAYGNHGIQNPQEVVLSDLPEGIFVNARVDVEGPWFAYTLDTDSDGSPDGIEGSGDRDSDGIPNYLDSYDPSGTVFSWDDTHAPAYSSAVSGVRIGLYVDEGNGVYDGTEAPAIVFQTNPQVTGADGAYRFDIVSGLPAPPASATFLLVIDEASLPEGYSFGLTPASSVTPPWMPQPTLNVGSTGFPYEVSLDPYPPNTFNEPYHIAFTLQQGDDEVVNNHIPLNVAQLRGGWDNGACAWRSTASSTYQVCDQMPALTGAILDATFEPNQSATIGVTYTQSYCHTLTNRGTDERFTIRFPAGSEAWTQQLEVRTGSCAGTLVHTINQGGSYTTSLLTTGASLYLVHNIMPPNGTPDGEIDFTTITVESTTDSRFTRTVTDVTTAAAGTIEGVVFDDNNRNGIQDIGEVGIPGVTVTLYDFLFPVATATTNANGEYTFDGIAPGALYVVELDPDTLNDPVFVDPVGGYSNFLAVFAGATVVQDFAVDVSSTTPDTTSFLELVISPSSVAAGGSSTFTIRVNKSTTPPQLTNVVVTIVINGLLEVGTITQSQGTYTIAQGTHGLYFKDAAAQTAHTVTFDLDTVALGSTVTMTIPVTVSSSAAAQTLNHYANLTGNSGTGTVTASVGPVGLTITTTSAQATATAQQANANATSTAAAASSSSSSAGSSSAQTSADTLPLTGYVAQPEANAPIDVLANILSGIVTTLLVIAGLAIGTWGLLLYFERLPQSFIDRFGWLRNDRTWYTGSIAFTILMTLFIVLQVIAPPATGPQVAEVPAEAADTQAPVDVVAVSAAANRGEQPAAAPDATRHVKPPDPATRLLIPKLGIDTEVVEAQAIGNTWDVTTFYEEAAHLEGTAHLGTRGNAVIAGHVRTEKGLGLFRNAKQLEVGDQIIAKGDGVEYVYEVLWTETVKPSEMGVVAPSDEAILTLITCTDWDNAQWTYLSRIIVRAKLVEVRPIE